MILEMTKSIMWSGAWNKAHFRNLLANTYEASTVSRALEWWSRGHGFYLNWEEFLMNFFCSSLCRDLSDNLIEMRIVKNPVETSKWSQFPWRSVTLLTPRRLHHQRNENWELHTNSWIGLSFSWKAILSDLADPEVDFYSFLLLII